MSRKGRYLEKWRGDFDFKTVVNAFGSFWATVFFALYNGLLGISHSSLWNGSVCVYYLLLSAVRGMILLAERNSAGQSGPQGRSIRRKAFRVSSALLLILNLALIVPVSLLARLERPVNIGLVPAIAMAAYTTCRIAVASVNLRKKGKSGNPLVRELRTVSFVDSLFSIIALQNTLISVNSADSADSMRVLSAVTSSAILLIIILLTALTTARELRRERE